MPQITLTRGNVQSLVSFCEAAKSNWFFIAKDHGAYVGFSTGPTPDKQCLFYFKGCNPAKDADFHENARRTFGGDDFGERLSLDNLRKALENPTTQRVRFTISATSIHMDTFA